MGEATTPVTPWMPTKINLVLASLKTSMTTCRVRTDAGDGYLKAFGGGDGNPHQLACEVLGMILADWLGLPTPEWVLFELGGMIDIPIQGGRTTDEGVGFLSKEIIGEPWSGDAVDIEGIVNLGDVTRLVIFDTWTRNCDRYCRYSDGDTRRNLGNVFIARDATRGRRRLIAMDHSHCFTCGNSINLRLSNIESTKSEMLFGLFPEFRRLIDFNVAREVALRLRAFERSTIEGAVSRIHRSWNVDDGLRRCICDYVAGRAQFLSDNVVQMLRVGCCPEGALY